MSTDEMVVHPSHYTSDPSGVECITIIRHRNHNIGAAIKYLWRNGLKKDEGLGDHKKQVQDLEKAIFYIQDEIKRLQEQHAATSEPVKIGSLHLGEITFDHLEASDITDIADRIETHHVKDGDIDSERWNNNVHLLDPLPDSITRHEFFRDGRGGTVVRLAPGDRLVPPGDRTYECVDCEVPDPWYRRIGRNFLDFFRSL